MLQWFGSKLRQFLQPWPLIQSRVNGAAADDQAEQQQPATEGPTDGVTPARILHHNPPKPPTYMQRDGTLVKGACDHLKTCLLGPSNGADWAVPFAHVHPLGAPRRRSVKLLFQHHFLGEVGRTVGVESLLRSASLPATVQHLC